MHVLLLQPCGPGSQASSISLWNSCRDFTSSLPPFSLTLRMPSVAAMAAAMVVMLLAQTVLMFFYARFVVFTIMGRDYEAAVMTAAFCGFGMGATANAMANMQALTKRYGPAPQAYFIVPLVGSLFIDFCNGLIITGFMNVLPWVQSLLP